MLTAFDEFRLISCDLPRPSAPGHNNSILLKTWIKLPLNGAKTSPGFADSSLSHSKGFKLSDSGLVVTKRPLRSLKHSPARCLRPMDLQKLPHIGSVAAQAIFCGSRETTRRQLFLSIFTTFSQHLHIQKGYLPISWLVPAFKYRVQDFHMAIFLPSYHHSCPYSPETSFAALI